MSETTTTSSSKGDDKNNQNHNNDDAEDTTTETTTIATTVTNDNAPPESPRPTTTTTTSDPTGGRIDDKNLSPSTRYKMKKATTERLTMRKNLTDGFNLMRRRRDLGPGEVRDDPIWPPKFLNKVLVNFIDPTSLSSLSAVTTTTTAKTSSSSSSSNQSSSNSSSAASTKQRPPLQLYEKFAAIFERDYNSRLSYVMYQNIRSGGSGVIESLPVRTYMTPAGGLISMSPGPIPDDDNDNSNDDHDDDFHHPDEDQEVLGEESQRRDNGRDRRDSNGSTGRNNKRNGSSSNKPPQPPPSSWSDAADWHIAPFCYVYMAACDGHEHYRTKVKPSIQAFISQLEAVASSASSTSSYHHYHGNNSTGVSSSPSVLSSMSSTTPSYVIIYVPTKGTLTSTGGTGSSSSPFEDNNAPFSRMGAALSRMTAASRARKAAAAQAASANLPIPTDSNHGSNHGGGGVSVTENSSDHDALSTADAGGSVTSSPVPSSSARLSKIEKEILRRLTVDFPDAKVCSMGTLLDATLPDPTTTSTAELVGVDDAEERQLERIEWSSAMKALGAAIADGFRERCKRYDDRLRRLDSKRIGSSSSSSRHHSIGSSHSTTSVSSVTSSVINSLGGGGGSSHMNYHFDLGNFFLVKESLAFTYEQIRLPGEALLQYEELRAFLPDLPTTERSRLDDNNVVVDGGDFGTDEGISRWSNHNWKSSVYDKAVLGNVIGFRRRIRSIDDANSVAHAFEYYMFGREAALLFKMNRPTEVVRRCTTFVKKYFKYKMLHVDVNSIDGIIEANRWAFDFCWDVKVSCEGFYNPVLSTADVVVDMMSTNDVGSGTPQQQQPEVRRKSEERMARQLCELLLFAKERLLTLGELVFGNSIRSPDLYDRIQDQSWPPWEAPAPNTGNDEDSTSGVVPSSSTSTHDISFLQNALSSMDQYRSCYVELLSVIAGCNESCGRNRYAASLILEAIEMHVDRGEIDKAIRQIEFVANVFEQDQWNASYFLLLFRMASLQRQAGTAIDYLFTLSKCFAAKFIDCAPSQALDALFNDFETVVNCIDVSNVSVISPPLFAPILGLIDFSTSRMIGASRSLMKRVYTVGDRVLLTIAITSYLPHAISLHSVSTSLVPFQAYVAAMEDSLSVQDEDCFHELTLKAPVHLNPGRNEFTIDWIPLEAGQFILASVSLRWKHARFTYASRELAGPTIRIDVLPCEPNQSIEVKPAFLLRGHEQPLTISLNSGADIVKDGLVTLDGSEEEIMLRHQGGTDVDWKSSIQIPLPPCLSGETVTVSVDVKTTALPEISTTSAEAEKSTPTLRLKVTSSYRRRLEESAPAETDSPTLYTGTLSEATIKTLNRSTLRVSGVDLISYSLGKAVLNVDVESQLSLTVRGWTMELPSYLTVTGDLNESLTDCKVIAGERLCFSFDCTNVATIHTSEQEVEPCLRIEAENECGFKFTECLALKSTAVFPSTVKSSEYITTSVRIETASMEATVGDPMAISYVIDLQELRSLNGRIIYKVDSKSVDWLLSGKTEGIVNVTGTTDPFFRVDLIAIPSRPGRIQRYPLLSLYLEKSETTTMTSYSDALIPLEVTGNDTIVFNAHCPENRTAFAFPEISSSRKLI